MPSRYPEAGRPADPGQGVDQGAALEAEGAADHRLAGTLYPERRATGHGKRDGFRPLRVAPDTARKAA
jgi:hypothetical protein